MLRSFITKINRSQVTPRLTSLNLIIPRPVSLAQRHFSAAKSRVLHDDVQPLDEIQLPKIPPQINLRHLQLQSNKQGNLMLLSGDQIASVRQALQGAPNGKYSKKYDLPNLGVQSKYSIIKMDEKLYAIYLGEKHNAICGKGVAGKVKLAQDLDTGEWIALKIQPVTPANSIQFIKRITATESHILNEMKASFGCFEHVSPTKGFRTYLLMKLVYGQTIRQYLNHLAKYQQPMSMQLALHISEQIIEALERLQSQYDVSHNDLHDQNVIYDHINAIVTPIDFGFSSFYSESSDPEVLMKGNLSKAGALIVDVCDSVSEEHDAKQKILNYASMMKKLNIVGQGQLTLSEIKAFFQKTRASLVERPLSIGQCDIAALTRGDHVENQQHIEKLKSHDLVYLYHDKDLWPLLYSYVDLKRTLEERHGLFIVDKVNWHQAGCLFARQEAGRQVAEELKTLGNRPEA